MQVMYDNKETTFTDSEASFGSGLVGMLLFPDIENNPTVAYEITSTTSTTLVVSGDVTEFGGEELAYVACERNLVYDSTSDESYYYDASATFESFHLGWTFVPDILKPCYLVVTGLSEVDESDIICLVFNGDITGLADPHSDRYHLIPPAGVSRTTGALAK